MDVMFYIALAMVLGGGAILFAISFFKADKQQQIKILTEWLLFAVTQAERELGGGTGEIKLRYVYDMFIQKFKYLARLISFEQFSELVDEALDKMRNMISNNENVASYVKRGDM